MVSEFFRAVMLSVGPYARSRNILFLDPFDCAQGDGKNEFHSSHFILYTV